MLTSFAVSLCSLVLVLYFQARLAARETRRQQGQGDCSPTIRR